MRHIVRSAFHAARPAIRSIRFPLPANCPRATFCSIRLKPRLDGAEQKGLQVRTYSSAGENLGRSIMTRSGPHSSLSDIFDLRAPQQLSSRPTSTQTTSSARERTEISVEQYNRAADAYLDDVQHVMEELQEEREDVDVEFSVCLPTGTCKIYPNFTAHWLLTCSLCITAYKITRLVSSQ